MLFALAGPADTDNISPAIWSVARDGSPVVVCVADVAVYRELQKVWWREECPNVKVISVVPWGPRGQFLERIGRLRWNRWRLKRALLRSDVRLAVMEWREGVAHQKLNHWQRLVRGKHIRRM